MPAALLDGGLGKKLAEKEHEVKQAYACTGNREEESKEDEDQEVPLSLMESLDDWYVSAMSKYHAFALCCRGRVHMSDTSPLQGLVESDRRMEVTQDWSLVCLKCRVVIEVRRWKQYRGYTCKRVVDGYAGAGRKRERSEGQPQIGWDNVARATTMM